MVLGAARWRENKRKSKIFNCLRLVADNFQRKSNPQSKKSLDAFALKIRLIA